MGGAPGSAPCATVQAVAFGERRRFTLSSWYASGDVVASKP